MVSLTIRQTTLTVIAAMLTFFLTSIVAATINQDRHIKAVNEAVTSGTLATSFHWPLSSGSEPTFRHDRTECLVLTMLILPRDPNLIRRSLSPVMPLELAEVDNPPPGYPPKCDFLRSNLDAVNSGADVGPTALYHRYLHGYFVLAQLMLGVMPFSVASASLFGLLLTELTILAILAWTNAYRLGKNGGRDRAYGTIALVLMGCWAMPAFDWSFVYAPSDIVLVGFLILFYSHPPGQMSEVALVRFSAVFGVAIAIFEFLTGGIPSALALLLGVLALDFWSDQRVLLRRTAMAVAAFCLAVVASFALKMLVVVLVWGPEELLIFKNALALRLGNSGWDPAADKTAYSYLQQLGISSDKLRSSRVLSTIYAFAKILYTTSPLAWGSRWLGIVLALVVPVLLAIRHLLKLRGSTPVNRLRNLVLLAGCAVVPLWYAVFVEHSIVHAVFMFRPCVWPLALLLAGEVSGSFARQTLGSGLKNLRQEALPYEIAS